MKYLLVGALALLLAGCGKPMTMEEYMESTLVCIKRGMVPVEQKNFNFQIVSVVCKRDTTYWTIQQLMEAE